MQYHISWNEEHQKWTLKDNDSDTWIRASWYKSWAIRKAMKYCRQHKPSELVVHLKSGHIEETRNYHR
jgi:hypothetical protein